MPVRDGHESAVAPLTGELLEVSRVMAADSADAHHGQPQRCAHADRSASP